MFKLKRKPKRGRQHAYQVRLRRMIQFGMLPTKPGLHQLFVLHDPACRLLVGGYCDCNAEFQFGPKVDSKTASTVQ
jgi:hypothetical protein